MKKLWIKLLWVINHKTDKYKEFVCKCPDLNYTEFRIYRIHKTFFIPYMKFETYFTDLGESNLKKREVWKYEQDLKKYINL